MTDEPQASPSQPPADAEPAVLAERFRYLHSASFPGLLTSLGSSLWVSTYQAGKLIVVRAAGDRLSMLLRSFDRAMGLAVRPDVAAVGARHQIWRLANAPDIAPRIEPAGQHDACYLPRSSHVTGDVRIHELAWVDDEIWFVNTRFSCLCSLDPRYSFVPRWRPPFVSSLAAEDRCHLNGVAIEAGRPRFVTALGESDTAGGWRENKASGGIVVEVDSGEVVAGGLSMPHSPRMHDGRLWLLDSGTGRLLSIEPTSGRTETVAELPGYGRGLALAGRYAFVGLSKFRESRTFGGLPIADRLAEPKCGVWVFDTQSGQLAATLEFAGSVDEIFDVALLAGIRFPSVIGLQKDDVGSIFVAPPWTR